jgi:RND superfamily putative drug exporter
MVLFAWVVALVLGAAGMAGLSDLLTNRFSVPGSDAENGLGVVKDRFGERSDGSFTVVFRAEDGNARDPRFRAAADRAAERAAGVLPEGSKAGPLLTAGEDLAYAQISSPLENADASNRTGAVRRAVGDVPGARSYVTGYPAIQQDTEPIYNKDLARGEAIALPIAILVMAFMFGTLAGVAVPLLFATFTIPVTMGLIWVAAHPLEMPVYVQNLSTMIGVAIAIDYSMLVVFRFREELEGGAGANEALERTMETAGRATMFSGMTVALGLALLVLMPLPFMSAMGVGGLLVPLVSIAAAATFLPALLSVMGHGINRLRIVPRSVLRSRNTAETGAWARLARSIMRRPVLYLLASGGIMLALALPAFKLHLTGGDNRGLPQNTESTRGFALLERTLGAGALSPNQVVVDTGRAGGAWSPRALAAQRRLVGALRADPEIRAETIQAPALLVRRTGPPSPAAVRRAQRANLADPEGRAFQIRAAGVRDIGTPQAGDLVERLRDRHVPAAGFGSARVLVTGAPAFNVDFVDTAYSAFPWLVTAVLLLTYFLLLRAFRSIVLPLKAVLMNLLSVAATYGVLVLAFQDGWGGPLGLTESPQIEAWIPIYLFAILFGLSMDYEVFLLSRMREEWDARHDNEEAVALGLAHTGRVITAAAIIMIAAFSGFIFGSFSWSQQFGLGLSAAVLLDATIVRALLVPATMKLLGDWNWYLPERIRRLMRVRPARRPAPAPPRAAPVAAESNGHGPPDLEADRLAGRR